MRLSFRKIPLGVFVSLFACVASAQDASIEVTDELRTRSVEIVRDTMAQEARWVKVHAAEHLLALGYPQGVREIFLGEMKTSGEEPEYRIGIWRVLAKAALSTDERESWVAKIRAAFLDVEGPDRLHATETLAKLYEVIPPADLAPYREAAQSEEGPMAAFANCILAHSGDVAGEEALARLLGAEEERTRLCAAYALRHVQPLAERTRQRLIEAALAEPIGSSARGYLLSSAYFHAGNAELLAGLLACAQDGTKSDKYETVCLLAERGDVAHMAMLIETLDDPEADLRQGAATAILRIERRIEHHLAPLDWLAICSYAALMLLIGWYYARKTRSTEDYLLGGRQMRPLLVGFSMFATLLSTLSYLAIPGEMIKHGPMISSQYLVYPLAFLVIGFVLIPSIMRMKVSSAYEILEARLGLSVRMLGSMFFLSMRFAWMALIIYATSSKVLVPMMGWDDAMIPVVCTIMGVITVAYTSMGGIRAVVMTDVLQTAILFGGAILTLGVITAEMGGVSGWFPKQWSPNWDPFLVMYDTTARLTVLGAMTSTFVWYICTAGADQVAIQRYLATRNPAAARRVIFTSLCTDVLTGSLLALLGLALWSWFQAKPHMLPDVYQTARNADTLFPRFIALALPSGISGMVIAGLLAAAMSSLSSGLNSSSLVISVDFINRFRNKEKQLDEQAALRESKRISVFVGISVVFLSIFVGSVAGNLLEMAYKVVNLLTAPLFVLFFMALFVPWATAPGAILAGIAATIMAVGIAYFNWFGLQFIWMMPLSLIAGVVVGCIASLVIGKAKPAEG
jgi:solute:Na+ symporter, SSS family